MERIHEDWKDLINDKETHIHHLKLEFTGSKSRDEYIRLYPFGRYVIAVRLSGDGKFLGIEEVRIDRDFRSYEQKIPEKAFRNIGDYVPEESREK